MRKLSVFSNLVLQKSILCLVVLMSACMVGFTSCSGDEDVTGQGIVGRWQSTHGTIWNKTNGVMDDESYDGPYTFTTLTFGADGKFKMVTSVFEDFNFAGTYKLSGNTLEMTVEGITENMNVLKLTDSQLIIEYFFDDGIDEYGDHLVGYMKLECQRIK